MTGPRGLRGRFVAACVLLPVLAAGCTSSSRSTEDGARRPDIVVASFNFPESVLLAHIYAGALRAAGYDVSVEADAGPREIVDPALARGLVDLVPEYSGSALLFFRLGSAQGVPGARSTHLALARTLTASGLVALSPAPAQNANAIVVRTDTAARYGLRTVSDLAPVAGNLLFGGPPECPDRLFCLGGLRSVYGLRFQGFAPLDTGGPLTLQALLAGEIDVALLFTTDPAITTNGLTVLRDDRGLQPAENVTPIIRRTALARHGAALREFIDGVSARLRTDVVRALDERVALGESPSRIASAWLTDQGLT